MEQFRTRTAELHDEQQRHELNELAGRAIRIVGVTSRFGFLVHGSEESHVTTVSTRPLYEPPTQSYYKGVLEKIDNRNGVRVCINEAGNFLDFPIQTVTHLAIDEDGMSVE